MFILKRKEGKHGHQEDNKENGTVLQMSSILLKTYFTGMSERKTEVFISS